MGRKAECFGTGLAGVPIAELGDKGGCELVILLKQMNRSKDYSSINLSKIPQSF